MTYLFMKSVVKGQLKDYAHSAIGKVVLHLTKKIKKLIIQILECIHR